MISGIISMCLGYYFFIFLRERGETSNSNDFTGIQLNVCMMIIIFSYGTGGDLIPDTDILWTFQANKWMIFEIPTGRRIFQICVENVLAL